jgi:hypothetical protein
MEAFCIALLVIEASLITIDTIAERKRKKARRREGER